MLTCTMCGKPYPLLVPDADICVPCQREGMRHGCYNPLVEDAQMADHFETWLAKYEHPDYRDETREQVTRLLCRDPALILDHSWPEIVRLAKV